MKVKIQCFNLVDIEILSKKLLYEGFFIMMLYEFCYKKYDGSWSDVVKWEMFEWGYVVVVLFYDFEIEEFVFIEQVCMGVMVIFDIFWLIEVIVGIIDEGEIQELVCYCEVVEEVGIELIYLFKVFSYLVSLGGIMERLYIYMVKIDVIKVLGVYGLVYELEDILVYWVVEKDVCEWLENGKIDNVVVIIVL